jgi:phospholipase C
LGEEPVRVNILGFSTLAVLGIGLAASASAELNAAPDGLNTATPIKHLVVVIGENRSFDHIYGTYVPKGRHAILNLLSEGIVRSDGSPGRHFAAARQFVTSGQTSYFISVAKMNKTAYTTLPAPTLGGAPNVQSTTLPPFPLGFLTSGLLTIIEPSLEEKDLLLLTTGATGAAVTSGAPDTRIANYAALPNGPFQLTGPSLLYDAYTGDTVHEFYQMWQQSDCSIRHATEDNPTGCLNDLYPFVATTFAGPTADRGGGTSLAFYNIQDGDALLLKELADKYTIGDNYHQPAQGGSGVQHVFLGTGDNIFWSDGNGNPAMPPISQIANPNPQPGTNNKYTANGNFTNCSALVAPGVLPIVGYLESLPYEVGANCKAGHYYMLNNTTPGFLRTACRTQQGRRFRRAMSGRSAMPSTTRASPGPITGAPTTPRSISPTDRRTHWMRSARRTAMSAIFRPMRRRS